MIRLFLYGALALALLFGYEYWADHQREIGRQEARGMEAEKGLLAARARLAESERIAREHKGIVDGAFKQANRARADAAAARGAAGRLQAELSAYRGRTCPGSATDGGGKAAGSAEGVLADVQRRLDEAADRIAEFADQSRIAGLACERKYDALTR